MQKKRLEAVDAEARQNSPLWGYGFLCGAPTLLDGEAPDWLLDCCFNKTRLNIWPGSR